MWTLKVPPSFPHSSSLPGHDDVFSRFFSALVGYADAMLDFAHALHDCDTEKVPGFDKLEDQFDNHKNYSGRFVDDFEEWIEALYAFL